MESLFSINELVSEIMSHLSRKDKRILASTCKRYGPLRVPYTLFERLKFLLKAQLNVRKLSNWYTIYDFTPSQTHIVRSSLLCGAVIPCYIATKSGNYILVYKGRVGLLKTDYKDLMEQSGFYKLTGGNYI